MLLSLQVKCDHYWPFTEEPIAYGDITVEMMSEEEQDDWACRHFRINYVSHGAGLQGPSPCRGNPQGQETHPPSWETMSALDLATLIPPRERCHNQCACFPEGDVDKMLGLDSWRTWNQKAALFRLRFTQGNRRHGDPWLTKHD